MDTPTDSTQVRPYTSGFVVAASVAILFNTALTLVKEMNPAVNAYMKGLLGHHWTTHGVAVVLIFIICGLLFSHLGSIRRMRGTTLAFALVISSVLGAAGIAGFFFFEL